MNKKISGLLFLLGIWLVIDGIGSILVYPEQPLIFDHLLRLGRTTVGIIIMYIGLKVD